MGEILPSSLTWKVDGTPLFVEEHGLPSSHVPFSM